MTEPQEKRALNWWIKATQVIRTTLKPHIDMYNSKHPVKLSGTLHVSVAKVLKSSNLLSPTVTPSLPEILKAYNKIVEESDAELTADEPMVVPEVTKLTRLLEIFFDSENTEIIIRRPRKRSCWC
jgi:hypothetical protein